MLQISVSQVQSGVTGVYGWCGYRITRTASYRWTVKTPSGSPLYKHDMYEFFDTLEEAKVAVGNHADYWMRNGPEQVAKLKLERDDLLALLDDIGHKALAAVPSGYCQDNTTPLSTAS